MAKAKYETDEERKAAIRKRENEYKKRSMRLVSIRFHKASDADVLARLDSVPNKADYVRTLIRKDIGGGGD